jgi:ABC-type Fe3+-hydroxamate transport system substrate-binding protein
MSAIRRVVSLVPSLSESVCALGAGSRLVGVTRFCVEPEAQLLGVARVGGTKNPDLRKIVSLQPDLVLVNTEENRAEDIGWLAQRFEVFESMPRTVVEVADVLRTLARHLGAEDEVEALLLELEAQCARAEVEGLELARLRVFYPIWRKPWMGVNRDTYIHDVLATVGAINVTADRDERYPRLRDEELGSLAPDLVLLPSEPWEFGAEDRDELRASGVFGSCPLLLVDGRDFCWHGTRTPRALGRAIDLLNAFRKAR